MKYTTIGLLKQLNHPNWRYFEFRRLLFLYNCLTVHWGEIQRGTGPVALHRWLLIFLVLELDRKAQLDLMLLANSGYCGRCEANEILWNVLSYWALKHDYEDLSNKVSQLVGKARRNIDRPPEKNKEGLWHEDLRWWSWSRYDVPRHPQWGPHAIPHGSSVILEEGTNLPLPPPRCVGPVEPPRHQ